MAEAKDIVPLPTFEPWARLPGEDPRSFAAFNAYKELGSGNRSLVAVTKKLFGFEENPEHYPAGRKAMDTVSLWAQKHMWKSRAVAYDQYVDRESTAAEINERKEAKKRHRGIALTLQGKLFEALNSKQADEFSAMEVTDLVKALGYAISLERQAIDAPSSVIQHQGSVEHNVEHTVNAADIRKNLRRAVGEIEEDSEVAGFAFMPENPGMNTSGLPALPAAGYQALSQETIEEHEKLMEMAMSMGLTAEDLQDPDLLRAAGMNEKLEFIDPKLIQPENVIENFDPLQEKPIPKETK